MKFDYTTNAALNEITATDNPAALIVAPTDYNKCEFISEVASRYEHVFWFIPAIDDMRFYCRVIIEKVMKNDPEAQMKAMQLWRCDSKYNGSTAVIKAVLDYVARLGETVLFVFDNIDMYPTDFDFGDYVFIAKHAPANLKIIFACEQFVNLDFTLFEPLYPVVVDKYNFRYLGDDDLASYLGENVTKEQLAFLVAVSELPFADAGAMREVYPEGADLLALLGKKDAFVCIRDNDKYRINPLLVSYLSGLKGELAGEMKKWEGKALLKATGDYYRKNGRDFEALKLYLNLNDKREADAALKTIFSGVGNLARAIDFVSVHTDNDAAEEENLPYYNLFCLAGRLCAGETGLAAEIAQIAEKFKKSGDKAFYAAKYFEYAAYIADGEGEKIIADLAAVRKELGTENPDEINGIVGLIPEFWRYISESPSELYDKVAGNEYYYRRVDYVKRLDDIASAFQEQGSYRRAMQVASYIKEYLPNYVIPHRLMTLKLYAGDIAEAENLLNSALEFAESNDIKNDIHMLYSTKAAIAFYYGRYKEMNELSDLAMSMLRKEDTEEKYFTIAQRCIMKAFTGEAKYAKELAHIYIKYTEQYAKKYLTLMYLAYAYACYCLNDSQTAKDYAALCVKESTAKSPLWFIAYGIVTNYMLVKDDLREGAKIVTNLLRASYNYGMKMLVVFNAEGFFAPILEYARANLIESEYVAEIDRAVRERNGSRDGAASLKLRCFGDVSITAEGKEIQWKTRKSKDLFMHYMLAGSGGIDRNVIIDILWKDYLYESAINNLKTTNNIIRKTLAAYGVFFKLEYINSKYILKIEDLEDERETFKQLIEKFKATPETARKIDYMNQLLDLYKGDFATDLTYGDFAYERKNLRQELTIGLLKLIRILAKQGDYLEAKHFLAELTLIDKQSDYSAMLKELDLHIKVTD